MVGATVGVEVGLEVVRAAAGNNVGGAVSVWVGRTLGSKPCSGRRTHIPWDTNWEQRLDESWVGRWDWQWWRGRAFGNNNTVLRLGKDVGSLPSQTLGTDAMVDKRGASGKQLGQTSLKRT